MPPLVQVSLMLMALSSLAIAVMGFVTLRRLERMIDYADRSMFRLEVFLDDANRTVEEGRTVLRSIGQTVDRVEMIVREAGRVSHRAARISGTLLDELEPPARRAIAFTRGVKAAARLLRERWGHFGHRATS